VSNLNTLNRIHNCTNPHQGKAKRVLCLCSAGLLRSPTTANVLHREFGFNTRAAGVSKEYALIETDDVLYNWADEIVAVERSVAMRVPEEFRHKLVTLDVPDMYGYMKTELQQIILEQYTNATTTISRTNPHNGDLS
jgi:predicted protein tyrosine phosphatase